MPVMKGVRSYPASVWGLGVMNLVMVKLITVEILVITEICHLSNRRLGGRWGTCLNFINLNNARPYVCVPSNKEALLG